MSNKEFKKELFTQFSRIGKALSNGNRLELLEFLAQGDRSVESLAKVSGLTIANTSQHLRQLYQSGLVKNHRVGQQVIYHLSDSAVVELLIVLRGIAQSNLAEVEKLVDTYLIAKDHLEPVSADGLMQRVRKGLVTILDVRPSEEFSAGHLPRAINITLEGLEKRIHEISKDRGVVAYCRGPYCMLAVDAVHELRKRGYQARRLEYGFPEWKNRGMPVEKESTVS